MSEYELITCQLERPALLVHGGAGSYLRTTTDVQRKERGNRLAQIAAYGFSCFESGGAKAGVLAAIAEMERDPRFNAGFGSKLQQDGVVRVSASLMEGKLSRLTGIYNVQGCLHPSALAAALLEEGDRNLDGEGAAILMKKLGVAAADLRAPQSLARWKYLSEAGETADSEAAIGDSGSEGAEKAAAEQIPMPDELRGKKDPSEDRYGTVGAVSVGPGGELWACTSTGGRGHEAVGRISDSPTPAGNYACPEVAISATGFGEQILDLNVCGRIATRVIDGMSLRDALARTFDEIVAFGGLLGVIAMTADGVAGYAHSTEACGVAWIDAAGAEHIDRHGR